MKWMNYDCIIRNGKNENTKRYNECKERGFFFFPLGVILFIVTRCI